MNRSTHLTPLSEGSLLLDLAMHRSGGWTRQLISSHLFVALNATAVAFLSYYLVPAHTLAGHMAVGLAGAAGLAWAAIVFQWALRGSGGGLSSAVSMPLATATVLFGAALVLLDTYNMLSSAQGLSALLFATIFGPRVTGMGFNATPQFSYSTPRSDVIWVIGSGEETRTFYEEWRRRDGDGSVTCLDGTGKRAGRRLFPDREDSPRFEGHMPDYKMQEPRAVVLADAPERLTREFRQELMRLPGLQIPVVSAPVYAKENWRIVNPSMVAESWTTGEGFALNRNRVVSGIKRFADVIGSFAAMVALAPLLALVAAAIKLDSPGPVIFRQRRVGVNAKTFTCLKFRTMADGSDKGDLYTRGNDKRITRLGGILRKTRLDELPQLWNVFRGEMSLIGPRAEWTRCTERYEREIRHYHLRHLVKPGITGWAQVKYDYGEGVEDAVEKLKYDLYYIQHYSFWLDIKILFRTVAIMVGAKGR